MNNPYQAPGANVDTAGAPAATPSPVQRSSLWLVYYIFYAIAFGFSFLAVIIAGYAMLATSIRVTDSQLVSLLYFIVSTLTFVGFSGYVFGARLLNQATWRVWFVFMIAIDIAYWVYHYSGLSAMRIELAKDSDLSFLAPHTGAVFFVVMGLYVLFCFPIYYGMYHYGFRLERFWRRKALAASHVY